MPLYWLALPRVSGQRFPVYLTGLFARTLDGFCRKIAYPPRVIAVKVRTRSQKSIPIYELHSNDDAELTNDMLDHIALGSLIFTAISLLFGAIAILDMPYKNAVNRNHPHQDAIYYAGWVSLFTLHAIWPLLWIWSAVYREDLSPRFAQINEDTAINDKAAAEASDTNADVESLDADITDSVTLLRHKFEVLDDRIERIEKAITSATEAA